MRSCWKCGAAWEEKHAPGMREACERCLSPWRACRNCRHYREKSREWCHEPAARDERPRDPEIATSCSFFQFADHSAAEKNSAAAPPPATPGWMEYEKPERKDPFA